MTDTAEVPKVSTFADEDNDAEMELLSVNEAGMCKVRFTDHEMDVTVTRNRSRVRPLNNAARRMLGLSERN